MIKFKNPILTREQEEVKNIKPLKGTVGGFSIEIGEHSYLYNSEKDRDSDFLYLESLEL